MTKLQLWSPDLEPLREEARAVTRRLADTSARPANDSEDPVAQAIAQREQYRQLERPSPAGRDEQVGGIPCRVFEAVDTERGTYLHLHGGGFFLGSPRMSDLRNEHLARELGLRVVSVDYRLAPEDPYPAGLDDCVAATLAVLDATRVPVIVGGESAGAQLAVATLLRLRDEGCLDRIAAANLVYGVFDLTNTPSMLGSQPSAMADRSLLGSRMAELYAPGPSKADLRDPLLSPVYADLHGMPPALFSVGTADGLLDDTLFLANRWAAWERCAELAVYPDGGHGFAQFDTEMARRCLARIDDFLTRQLAAGPVG